MSRFVRRPGRGFSLVELVITIAVLGVLAVTSAVFIRGQMQAYLDTERRVELADQADLALRRMMRDLRLALPNSIRVTQSAAGAWLEYLPIVTAGRYRDASSGAATAPACPPDNATLADNDVLDFTRADTCFKTIGNLPNLGDVQVGHLVVLYNLGAGYPGADAYAATNPNRSTITALPTSAGGEDRIAIAGFRFPLASPGRRFYIVGAPVTYACDAAAGTLARITGYALQEAQPVPPAGTASTLLEGVTACAITYQQNIVAARSGVVAIRLQLGSTDERFHLFVTTHVSNIP